MLAEIITIGDELLIGQVVDTNSAFIAKQLNKIGISVYQITSIQDSEQHILQALQNAENRVDIVICTGGLGPTKDDITKKTIAEYFNDTLVKSEIVLKNIKNIWKQHVGTKLLQANIDQALIPSQSSPLTNRLGTAPGIWIEKSEKVFISLPGVPYEMKALIDDEVIPKLKAKYKCPFILHKTMLVYGIGESALAAKIEDWENQLPKHIKLAYLPNLGKMRLRLSAIGDNEALIKNQVQEQVDKLIPLIKDEYAGVEDEDGAVEVIIAEKLKELGCTLAVAESCTGGALAQCFTSRSGASTFFKGGLVTYATQSKIDVLKVSKLDIDKYSVVSTQVAEAMATQAQNIFKTDYAIATTGNAGPKKGDSNAKIGTVVIAVATKTRVYSQEFNFGNSRLKVVNKSISKALEMLLKEIIKN